MKLTNLYNIQTILNKMDADTLSKQIRMNLLDQGDTQQVGLQFALLNSGGALFKTFLQLLEKLDEISDLSGIKFDTDSGNIGLICSFPPTED